MNEDISDSYKDNEPFLNGHNKEDVFNVNGSEYSHRLPNSLSERSIYIIDILIGINIGE